MELTIGLGLGLAALVGLAGYLAGLIHAHRAVDNAMAVAEERIDLLERRAKKERMLLTVRAQLAESRARSLKGDLAKFAKADVEAAAELRRGKKLQGAR